MGIALPTGVILTPVANGIDAALLGSRVTTYSFDLLDGNDALIGTLDGVETGGSITWDAYASVKSGGTIPVTDVRQDVNWLQVRIRPKAVLALAGGGDDPTGREIPLGIYLPAAPKQNWNENGRTWSVEMLDKLSILDQDTYTDSSGNAVAYGATAGANILDLVRTLINDAGEATPAIGTGTAVLAADQVWDAGSSRLKIVNDLLTQSGYFSLYCDGAGQYRATPYVEPANRVPVYMTSNPFEKGPNSLMASDWTLDEDIYGIPNRYVAIGQGDGTTEALVATATNTNPLSPFSYANRGRWITQVETGVEAVDVAALLAHAKRRLSSLTSVNQAIDVRHMLLPDVTINSVVRFVHAEAEVDTLFTVLKTTVNLDPLALAASSLQEVL